MYRVTIRLVMVAASAVEGGVARLVPACY